MHPKHHDRGRWARAVLIAAMAAGIFTGAGPGRAAGTDQLSFAGPAALSFEPHHVLYVSDGPGGLKELSTRGELLRTLQIQGAIVDRSSGILYSYGGAVRRGHGYAGEIRKFSPAGKLIARLLDRRFLNAQAMALGGKGTLFLAVLARGQKGPGSRIYKLTPNGKVLLSWPAGNAGFDFFAVTGEALDRSGNVYLSGPAGSCSRGCQGRDAVLVERYSPAGKLTSTWRLSPDAPLAKGLAVDTAGNVVMAGHDQVEKLSPQGRVLFSAGAVGCGPLRFKDIEGVAVDDSGTIYVSDSENRNVHKLSPDGTPLALWGGCPSFVPPTPITRPTQVG